MFESLDITLIGGKKIYFASDFHLGSPNEQESRTRELKIIQWLDSISSDAQAIFLVGDLFDFWYEYKRAIPKGFTRFLGKIAELVDSGIPVYFFIGNHDMWMFDYFEKELGVTILRNPIQLSINNTRFLVGHGDGLGPKDHLYKFFKLFFRSKFCQWLFGRLHPNLGIGIANLWSSKSRKSGEKKPDIFINEEEWIFQYCKEIETEHHHDVYIFGHRHLVIDMPVNDNSRYLNLGQWMSESQCRYASFDGQETIMDHFKT